MAEYELLELVDLGEGELGDVSFYFLVEYLRAEELVVGHGEIGDHFLDEGGVYFGDDPDLGGIDEVEEIVVGLLPGFEVVVCE